MWKSIGSLIEVNHDLFCSARNWVPQLALYFLKSLSTTDRLPGMLCLCKSLIPTFMAVPVERRYNAKWSDMHVLTRGAMIPAPDPPTKYDF